jgi:hypothetical protein
MIAPSISIVTMDQRMALFRDAMRVSSVDCPLGKDRADHVIDVFNRFLDGIVRGIPIPLDIDAGHGPTILEEFFADRCRLGEGMKVQARPLYDAFCGWAAQTYPENTIPTLSSFGIEMRKRFAKKQSNVVYFLGLELKDESSQSILS